MAVKISLITWLIPVSQWIDCQFTGIENYVFEPLQ